MSLPDFAITSDSELRDAVRGATSYGDTADELPQSQLESRVDDAKREMYGRTGSDDWYSDVNYGQALMAWTCIVSKAAVENINIASYDIADESITLENASPDDSTQMQIWLEQVSRALDDADVNFEKKQRLGLSNTASYIG
jgi:hypothetical protein